jgi:hypothetical protein
LVPAVNAWRPAWIRKAGAVAAALAWGSSAVSAGALPLASEGQPKAAIVVAAGQTKARAAAEAIQKYVEKMSGAKLTLVEEGAPGADAKGPRVLVGPTAEAAKLGVKIPAGHDPSVRPNAFEEEGYVLETRGDALVVAGNDDGPWRGTQDAAWALLEKLGCRWYFPGDFGEVVPLRKTVEVPELHLAVKPDFPVRMIWLSGWVPVSKDEAKAYEEWTGKVGMNAFRDDRLYPTAGDGFLAYLLPPDKYFATKPEYYAMDKSGSRKPHLNKAGKMYENFTMLCLSNPEVFAESVKNLKEAFAGKVKSRIVQGNGFGISPPDGAPFCYCPKCLEASQGFRYPAYIHERMQSEEFFAFAARLAREFPDKYVATMAYALREMPPQGVELPPNVSVTFAPISSCVLHAVDDPRCWRRVEAGRILRQWRKLTPHLMIYDYTPGFLTGFFVPERDVANLAANMPTYKEVGIKGMRREGRKAFMQTWIGYYVNAKLFWDAKADVAAIKKDFYETFFGPKAGPLVQAWWDACEKALGDSSLHFHEDWLANTIYTPEFVKGIGRFVEEARRAEMTPAQKARFEAFALIADHLAAYAEMEEADRNLDYPKAAAGAARAAELKKKLHATWSFFISPDERPKPRSFFAEGRRLRYEECAAKAGGAAGEMVAPLPLEMKFRRDPFNEGVVAEWYADGLDDKDWGTLDTFHAWDLQMKPEDAAGHDWDGYGWYRGSFEAPAKFAGKPVRFWCGGTINEGWVWINGKYAGHSPHKLWWSHPRDFELDVGALVKPGRNTIAIRVWNDTDIGGLFRRGFLYSPREAPAAAPAPKAP